MKYVVFDTETTGLTFGKDDVIQLAYVVLNDNLQIIDAGSKYNNTDVEISAGALNVHGITKQFLDEKAGSRFLKDVIDSDKYFNGEEKDIIYLAYNSSFDINIINKKLNARGYNGVDFGPAIKSLNQTKGRYHFCMMQGLQRLRLWSGRKSLTKVREILLPNVSDETINSIYDLMVKQYKIDVKEGSSYHDALYDSLVTALLFANMRDKLNGLQSNK